MRIENASLTFTNSGDMSQPSITSQPIQLNHIGMMCVQVAYTGSPSGTLKLQASVDGSTWTDLANTSASISAAGSTLWELPTTTYPNLRVVYTKTSGSGTLSGNYYGKGF